MFWDGEIGNTVIQNCTDFYYISSGYRKIPGDDCKSGLSYEPVKIPCPKAIKEFDQIKQQQQYKRLVIGSIIVAFILLILYSKWNDLVSNFWVMVQNIQYLFGRSKFNYEKFESDQDGQDFSKMVFDDDEE